MLGQADYFRMRRDYRPMSGLEDNADSASGCYRINGGNTRNAPKFIDHTTTDRFVGARSGSGLYRRFRGHITRRTEFGHLSQRCLYWKCGWSLKNSYLAF
jgi:hypothetical protein